MVVSDLSSEATTKMAASFSTPAPSTMTNDDGDEGPREGRTTREVENDEDGAKMTLLLAHIYRPNRIQRDDADVVLPSTANDAGVVDGGDRDFFALISDHHDDGDDANDGPKLLGIGMPRRQFATWVHYYLTHMTSDGEARTSKTTSSSFTTTTVATASTTTANVDDMTREGRQRALDDILCHVVTQELDWDEDYDDEEEDGGIAFGVWWDDERGMSAASPSRPRREQREAILRYWDEGRLICEHTNLLSSGRRRRRSRRRINDGVGDNTTDVATDDVEGVGTLSASEEDAEEDRRNKLERFVGMLEAYAHRLASIVEEELSVIDDDGDDEADDCHYRSSPPGQFYSLNSPSSASSLNGASTADTIVQADLPKGSMSNSGLRRFIEKEYGSENARLLMARTLLQKSEIEQLKVRIRLRIIFVLSRVLTVSMESYQPSLIKNFSLNLFPEIAFDRLSNHF
jgi:hypothetical protein